MIISILIILIFSIALSIYFNKQIVVCIPFSIFSIIITLYIFGLFKLLTLGLFIIYIFAFLLMLYISLLIITKKIRIRNLVDIGTFFFIGMVIILFSYLYGSKIICLDEFTAWGLFTKSMYYTNNLHVFSSFPIHAKSYASSTAIFQYFILKNSFGFYETHLLMATNIIYLSIFAITFKNLKFKNFLEAFLRAILILIIPMSMYMWPAVYFTILVDVIFGFVFAYIIYYYFTNKYDLFAILNISLAVFFLCCSKGNGLVLSLIALFLIHVDLFIFKNYFHKIYNIKTKTFKPKIILKTFIPFFTVIFTFFSWVLILRILNINGQTISGTTSIVKLLFKREFLNNLNIYFSVIMVIIREYSTLIVVFLMFLYIMLISSLKKGIKQNFRKIFNVIIYNLLIMAYIFFLFLVVQSFNNVPLAADGLRRYLYTVVAANIMLAVLFTIRYTKKRFNISSTIIIIVLFILYTPASWRIYTYINGSHSKEAIEFKNDYNKINELLNLVDIKNDIVYFVGQNENDNAIANYNLFPFILYSFPHKPEEMLEENYINYILSKPSLPLYKINNQRENTALIKKTKGNIYIYIYKYTEEFHEKYKYFFEDNIDDDTIYIINKQQNKLKKKGE